MSQIAFNFKIYIGTSNYYCTNKVLGLLDPYRGNEGQDLFFIPTFFSNFFHFPNQFPTPCVALQ